MPPSPETSRAGSPHAIEQSQDEPDTGEKESTTYGRESHGLALEAPLESDDDGEYIAVSFELVYAFLCCMLAPRRLHLGPSAQPTVPLNWTYEYARLTAY